MASEGLPAFRTLTCVACGDRFTQRRKGRTALTCPSSRCKRKRINSLVRVLELRAETVDAIEALANRNGRSMRAELEALIDERCVA